jgi:hypothetical protein
MASYKPAMTITGNHISIGIAHSCAGTRGGVRVSRSRDMKTLQAVHRSGEDAA